MGWGVIAGQIVIAGLVALTAFFNARGRDRLNKANEFLSAQSSEIHTEVKSVNGQTTAQNIENLVTQMETDSPDQPPHEPRRNGG